MSGIKKYPSQISDGNLSFFFQEPIDSGAEQLNCIAKLLRSAVYQEVPQIRNDGTNEKLSDEGYESAAWEQSAERPSCIADRSGRKRMERIFYEIRF